MKAAIQHVAATLIVVAVIAAMTVAGIGIYQAIYTDGYYQGRWDLREEQAGNKCTCTNCQCKTTK